MPTPCPIGIVYIENSMDDSTKFSLEAPKSDTNFYDESRFKEVQQGCEPLNDDLDEQQLGTS